MPLSSETTDPVKLLREIRRSQKRQRNSQVVLYLVLTVVVGYIFITTQRTHDALCTLRADLQTRVSQSELFLADHPQGAFGFTPTQIRQQIQNQQNTIDSLEPLHCG
jgi:hypothetical protein